MKVLFFGVLKDITKKDKIEISGVKNLSELKRKIFEMYPELSKRKFSIAVNKEIKNGDDIPLKDDDEIALLPPFAGG